MKNKKQINRELLKLLKEKGTPQEVIQKILGSLTNYVNDRVRLQRVRDTVNEIGA